MTKMRDGLIQRGSTWSYTVRVRDANTGKMKDQWHGGFATKKEARTARNDARALSDKGTAVAASKITVKEYLEQWLEASETRVRPTTLRSYRQHVDGLIVPQIGGERLQQLTPLMVKQLYATLGREGRKSKCKVKEGAKPLPPTGLSASTIRRVAATLHKALADARDDGLIPFNPSDGSKLPKIERDSDGAGDAQTWSREELDQFLAHVASDRLFPLWRLAAWTGMRRGELAGLSWRDVALEDGTIHVLRARVAVGSSDVRESKPKTAKGRRQVELDADTARALTAWQERQEKERAEWPGVWPDHGLVFTLQDGSALHPDYLSRSFRAHVKKAKLPMVRLHDLRHTHATLMLAAGVPVKVVSTRLGHSTVSFTMECYQHVLPGDQRGHVQNLANAETKAARHLKAVGD